MYYPIINKLENNPLAVFKTASSLKSKIKSILCTWMTRDKELAILMNEMDVDLPVTQRAWNRHSALLVHSKYHHSK